MISNILLIIVVFSLISFFPVWILAKLIKVKRATWKASALAALQIGILFAASQSTYLPNAYFTSALQLLGGAFIYSYTLGTGFFRGLAINIIVIALFIAVVFLIGGSAVSININQ